MGREQDWKEIEKTQLNYEQGIKDQYKGIDIVKISKENRKTIHKMKKINAKADKLVKALFIWYVIFLILLVLKLSALIRALKLDNPKYTASAPLLIAAKNASSFPEGASNSTVFILSPYSLLSWY